MKFQATPNLYVKLKNIMVQRSAKAKGICFNEYGIYETDNELLCKVLAQHFKIIEEPLKEVKKKVK